MVLHTDDPTGPRDGHARDLARRCLRLRDVLHPGQAVLSRSTYELVAHRLPAGVSLKDLGAHRVGDPARAEHLYQLCHPELPQEFPPLRSLDVLPNNLPVQLTSFIGRQAEMVEVKNLLRTARLLTLLGAGGCGKTRLALQVAAELVGDYSDGVWFVDLAPITDPSRVPNAVASALSVREEPFGSLTETIARNIASSRQLVVLDNCEHVVTGCAELSAALLTSCPQLKCLATSREPLGVPGETTWRVPSLSLPDKDDRVPIEALSQYEAVELFIDRALRARPNFAVTNDNAPAVADICHRLDGIPLAIELAAARVRVLTAQQIADGLNDRFRLLTGGARTLMPRQQTLQASLDWSYEHLSEPEQVLLRRLSVFAGGFSLEAAAGVCSGESIERSEVLDLLANLVDKSLIVVDEQRDPARYRLSETVRSYARDRLGEAGEDEFVRTRHRDFYLSLAERIEPKLTGWEQDLGCDLLEADNDNLRIALEWSKQQDDAEALLRLAGSLTFFWFMRGYLGEGRRWLELALEHGEGAPPPLRAKALVSLAAIAMYLFDLFTVPSLAEEGLDLYRELGDKTGMARALLFVGWPAVFAEGLDAARPPLEESVKLAREAGDEWALGMALQGLGAMYVNYGDPLQARRVLEESISVARPIGAKFVVLASLTFLGWAAFWQGELSEGRTVLEEAAALARDAKNAFYLQMALGFLGGVLCGSGDYDAARACCEESLEIARESQNPFSEGHALLFVGWAARAKNDLLGARTAFELALSLPLMPTIQVTCLLGLGDVEVSHGNREAGRAHLEQSLALSQELGIKWAQAMSLLFLSRAERLEGDLERAETRCHDALALQGQIGDKAGIAASLETLAGLSAEQESFDAAARLFGASAALRESIGFVRFACEREGYEADLALLRSGLGDEQVLQQAWSEGAAMSVDEALRYASKGRGGRRRPSAGWPSLTPTESEVVKLVAEGLTNPQIGERLFISRRTVQTHLYRIFGKLGVSSRSELASRAAREQK